MRKDNKKNTNTAICSHKKSSTAFADLVKDTKILCLLFTFAIPT
ncbi:hypothetical protein HMPREF3034_02180 [Prevotella sp. DNF00663]|nr:hypothetical protein HMPREF3034_02180 [Prevotella sp. DNF00663]